MPMQRVIRIHEPLSYLCNGSFVYKRVCHAYATDPSYTCAPLIAMQRTVRIHEALSCLGNGSFVYMSQLPAQHSTQKNPPAQGQTDSIVFKPCSRRICRRI